MPQSTPPLARDRYERALAGYRRRSRTRSAVCWRRRAAARKSRGNNGARRDMHAGMEEDVVDIINTTA